MNAHSSLVNQARLLGNGETSTRQLFATWLGEHEATSQRSKAVRGIMGLCRGGGSQMQWRRGMQSKWEGTTVAIPPPTWDELRGSLLHPARSLTRSPSMPLARLINTLKSYFFHEVFDANVLGIYSPMKPKYSPQHLLTLLRVSVASPFFPLQTFGW